MNCNDLDSLQESYAKAVREFTANVKELRAHTADIPATEYLLLAKLAERARAKADAAQRALRNHIIEHGCC
jgi:CHASE3 domain sensor protein